MQNKKASGGNLIRIILIFCCLRLLCLMMHKHSYKTDEEIQADVMEEMKWDPLFNSAAIGVAVTNGIVTLSGTVDSYFKKITAEQAAWKVKGVKAVAEEIEIKLDDHHKKNDTEIAMAVADALKWHSELDARKIRVKVENGWVTLEGEVDWAFKKKSAQAMVETLAGIKGIINAIKIKPMVEDTDVKKKIEAAFQRNAVIDAEKIKVKVEDNRAFLSGRVRSWSEKIDAEKAAWSAPGIIEVISELEIDEEIPVL
jgi:osmotically-inducible protein OsmY